MPVATIRADDLSARLVILANSRQPESVALARFYAEQRHVPMANIIALPMPEEESVTWRQFIDQVWLPVQDELYRRGWIEGTASSLFDRLGRGRYAFTGHRISYLVVCRGVPLRIYNDPTLLPPATGRKVTEQFNKNEGAVDGELSLLALGNYEITGLIGNPLFAQQGVTTLDAAQVVKVCRLDGPTWESVRHLVTSALEAERVGLAGRAYVDLKGPHAEGDGWLGATRDQLRDLGFDADVEETSAVFTGGARFDAPIFYFGWYTDNLNGPFAREGFAFPAGAVALHIHSFSGQTLHSDTTAWCGPLVARGVTATVGNVFEPFLEFTHRPNLLLRALSEGRNFGDAAYYALPALSWQAVAIGDPLYRPFKISLAEQLAKAATLGPARAAYVWLRQANLLEKRGQKADAAAALHAAERSVRLAGNAPLVADVARRLARLDSGATGQGDAPLVVK
ncbi:MAG TPA: TIGR03790 family protein [Lacunisphaera sp.]